MKASDILFIIFLCGMGLLMMGILIGGIIPMGKIETREIVPAFRMEITSTDMSPKR